MYQQIDSFMLIDELLYFYINHKVLGQQSILFFYILVHSPKHRALFIVCVIFVGLYMHIILKCERIWEGHRKDIGKHWGENTAGGFVVYDIMFKFSLIMKMQIFAFIFYWYMAINSYVGARSDSPNEKRSTRALSLPFK